jgi:hypothetical protein
MRFLLSNAQKKEALLRGRRLRIVLPLQRGDVDDGEALSAARAWLLLPPGLALDSVTIEEVSVVAPRSRGEPRNLTDVLGAIVAGQSARDAVASGDIVTTQVALVCFVSGPGAKPGNAMLMQWPGGPLPDRETGDSDGE